MTPTPSPTQVASLVSTVRKRIPAARRIGVRYEGRWTGPETLLAGADPVRVAWCPSSLAARDALADAKDTGSVETIVQSLIQLLGYSIDKDKDMVGELEETLRFADESQYPQQVTELRGILARAHMLAGDLTRAVETAGRHEDAHEY